MHLISPDKDDLFEYLKQIASNSLDFVVLITAALDPSNCSELKAYLDECVRAMKNGGLLFVQGRPDYLPELGVHLDQQLNFKYWIAVESTVQTRDKGLPSSHAAILLFSKGSGRFNVKRTRFPHQYCAFCGKPLRDWGGKAHLMHPDGFAVSDVWTSLPPANNYDQLTVPVVDTMLRMLDFQDNGNERIRLPEDKISRGNHDTVTGLIAPEEGIAHDDILKESTIQYRLPKLLDPEIVKSEAVNAVNGQMYDVVHCGDALDILRQYPDNSVDLVFADPPYNLDKAYSIYDDERDTKRYVDWCNAWLKEYIRVLKPTGSLYVLNLPRWSMYHAAFLNQYLYFQNWIVWDALSEPRGKLMPAHYGLLFYTKHPKDFTFNYDEVKKLDARYYCLRQSCIRGRKSAGVDDKEPLTDFWLDIHRIKHRRDRDYHPCQLPEALMERIIRLSTNKGDIVLDALCGTGTTPVVATSLGRRYVAIDLDEKYVKITRDKIADVQCMGYVRRQSTRKPQLHYTKKRLQLELRDLAAKLGRLPTPEDVGKMTPYDPQILFDMFPTWGKALKAAKLVVEND